MKKILLSIISIFVLCFGVVLTGCGGGDVVSAIVLESSSFANEDKNYIEMDVTTEENPSVTIKATIENQENGRISVVNPNSKVSVSTSYNANINSNTITITALEEGTTDLVIKAMSGVVEDKKVRIYVYSDITGLAQKEDSLTEKKTQYIVMDQNITLDSDTYLDISAKASCNRKDIVWSVIEDYGNSLSIRNGNLLRLDSYLFEEYKKSVGEDLNQITIQAQSKYKPEITAEVTLDILTGIADEDATVQASYLLGGTKFDVVDADGNALSTELVRTNSADEHSVLYYYVDIKTENNISWVSLTDEVLYKNFGVPTGTLDITNELYSYDDATKTHSYVFKVINENSQAPGNYEINFSFAYENYDYVFTTQDVKIALIDVVTKVEVTNSNGDILNDKAVEIYNSYANGKGHFFNVNLTPTTAKDTSYYLKLKVAKEIANLPSFNFLDYVEIYTEAGGLINFAIDESVVSDDYVYFNSVNGEELRTFANATRIYAISKQPSSAFELCFYSNAKQVVHTTVKMNFVFAPNENFDIASDSLDIKLETSKPSTKTITFTSSKLASVDVNSLSLVYDKSENYEVSALRKTLDTLSFDISVLKTNVNETFDIQLVHKNGFMANSSFEVELFKALTSASVSLLKSNSNNIAKYGYLDQTFGGGENYSLSDLIVNFGTSVEFEFDHDAGDDVTIEIRYFIDEFFYGKYYTGDTLKTYLEQLKELELRDELAEFFNKYDPSYTTSGYMEYIPSLHMLNFMTSKETSFTGYVVVEFTGYDATHTQTKLYRIINIESYVPVSMLSTKSTLIETTASDSLSALDAESLSKKSVEVKFRNDPISVIPITYTNLAPNGEEPYFQIYSASAGKANLTGNYEFKEDTKTLLYKGLPIYALNELTVTGKSMTFDIYAYTTSEFTEFVDTLVIEYNSFFSTFRLSIEIVISNSQRVTSVIWENATDDGSMYLLLSADGSITENNKHTIITTVSEAYNTELVYKYNALSGQNNVISFVDNGKYKDVVVNNTARIGGNGYIYVLPADSVKTNNQINYNYYDEGGNIATGYVSLSDLNYKKGDATWYDYLTKNAFFIDAKGDVVPFSKILVRIYLIVADGLSEDTALRIYTAEELSRMSYVNHYVLMNDVELSLTAPLFDFISGEPEISFIGSLRGYNEDVTITFENSTSLFYQIGADGKVYDLTFNGTINTTTRATGAAFVAHRNNGLIDNVTVDVYYDGTKYVPSEVNGFTFAGAIVQENNGTIKNTSALGVSISAQTIGGIAGQSSGIIENCVVEMYKFETDTPGTTEANSFDAKNYIGGIVGRASSSSAKILNSYIYDYSLDDTSISSNFLGTTNVGAFIGGKGEFEDKVLISNSFAVVNVSNAATSDFVTLEDCYISYFKNDGEIKYHSDLTITNSSNWITTTDANFNSKANGYGDYSFDHLKFHQLEFVDISSLVFASNSNFIKVNDTSAILFLYEVDTHRDLSTVENLALSNRNTYSIETLFGLEERLAEGLVVSSSDTNIVETSLSSIEVKKTGTITLNVLSKQDFSISEPYTIEIIRVIKDFKANYNGYETTGIEVQEGRSAQLDFTTLSSIYLNSSTNFDLVLDKFVVTTDNELIEKDGTTYAVYSVENAVGMINVFAGAKTEVGTFVVNSYITLASLSVDSNEALKEYSYKELTITPFEGSNEIGVDYSSLTIYPSLSTQFEVVLDTDSATDGLIITSEYEGAKLNVYKVNADGTLSKISSKQIVVNPNEKGEYVLSFGELEKRIVANITSTAYNMTTNEITYKISLKIHDDYKSSIATNENYKLIFNSKNDKELALTKTLDVILESQKIDNIDITNYKISQVSNRNGIYHYTKTNTSVSLMAPGQSSIFEVTIDPKYSYYEYLTVSYIPQNGGLLTFSALNKEGDGYTSNSNSSVTNIAYGIKVVPTEKTSVYAFKLYVSTNISSDCVFPITISFYGYNEDGSPKLLESREISLYITCMQQPSVLVNGSEFTKVSKGSEAMVEVTVNTDQDLESLTLEGAIVENITLSLQTINNNENGTKTYVYKLKANVLAKVDYDVLNNPSGVGQFEIKGTIARVLDGVRETKSMSAYVALVEFDVSSVEIYGAEYDEGLGMDLFTAYENVTKPFEFSYDFVPESYGLNLTTDELSTVKDLNLKKADFSEKGYYTDEKSYYINYSYNSETNEYTPISLKDQLYVLSSTKKEQKLNWTLVSGSDNVYTYTHYEGNYEKFKLTYNETSKQFVIMGNSTTSSPVLFRLKNITYLKNAGTNVYWESNYDFAIRVKSYTSEDSPEAINNAQDFLDIQKEGEAKPYILMNDIVLENYVPFDTTLISSLDGNGYTIHINSFDKSAQVGTFNASLFTNVSSNTILKNIRVNWYNGGQLSIDTSESGFSNIQVAGLAITNNGIIYNCEVVAYYSESHNTEISSDVQGLVVSYTRGQTPYYIDGNSSVISVVAGLVIDNAGNITNSRVGGESLRLLDETMAEDALIGKAYYKDTALETFTISAQGEVNGFVSSNSKNIASSKVTNVQITNGSAYNGFETSGFANTNSGSISTSYIAGKDDGTSTFSYLSTNIDSEGYIAGFVMNNAIGGDISNCMSNILISNTSLFGSGFVYKNEGNIAYSFSASQVEKSSYTQMGFTGLDETGSLLSDKGTISFSYYYDMNFTSGSNLENQIDTGAMLLDLGASNSISQYYGLSFANGDSEEEMLANADGIWYMREDGKISIISADTISYSIRYIAGYASDNSFLYVYSDMIDNDIESYTFNTRYTTQYGSKYNPIIIADAADFDEAMGNSESTNISSYYNSREVFGSYRFVDNISLDELGKNAEGNIAVSSTSKTLTYKTDRAGNVLGVGQIDGNGFKIENISIATNEKSVNGGAQSFGLFASLTNGAKILNLDLGILNVTADDVYVVGGLAGLVYNSSVINVHIDQNYVVDSSEDLEASDDGVMGQNIAGGVIGVAFGTSTIKNVTINNSITKVSHYDSGRNATEKDNDGDGIIDEYTTNDFYINSINLINNRTNLLTNSTILSMFSSYSIAGGIIGYADVFDEEQRVQTTYVHKADGERTYRIKNLTADVTVNVRGEIVGGVFGYTSPTTNSENIKLRLSVDAENNAYISKILSYNSYAGGIVGLGNGYFYRVTTEHDEITQKAIEEGYSSYYRSGEEEVQRGILDLFYTTYSGSIAYDYKTQIIGGIVGVMSNGEIENSYSKINVIAEPESKTTAGGVIGRVTEKGTIFSFMIDAKIGTGDDEESVTTSGSVVLKEVYASGDVRGGYYKVVNGANIKEYGFGGGIVGTLDRNSILALQSVNAVNAFSYEGVITKAEIEGEAKKGDMSSVGVYAFVSGEASTRGTIRIIMPPTYDKEGDASGVSVKSLGYYAYIKNLEGEKISIEAYPGVLRVAYTPNQGGQAIFEIISVSEFTGIIDGYNSVLSAFLVGEHWDPTNWEHTDEYIYPQIKYTSFRTFYFLDRDNVAEVVSHMQNSDVTVYVRGLDEATGTYGDVDLTGYTIIGFNGELVGPAGWLSEEELANGVIARHKKDGDFVGINLRTALFVNSKTFTCRDLDIIYGVRDTDPDAGSDNKKGILNDRDKIVEVDTNGSAFISGSAEKVKLSNLKFHILNHTFTISPVNGNAGFIASSISDCNLENLEIIVDLPSGLTGNNNAVLNVATNTSIEDLNVGVFVGKLEVGSDNVIEGNTVEIENLAKTMLEVTNSSAETKNINVGGLIGYVSNIPTISDTSPVEILNFATDDLIVFNNNVADTSNSKIYIGGQIGKITGVRTLSAGASIGERDNAVYLTGKFGEVYYGGIIGYVDSLEKFSLNGAGIIGAKISNSNLINQAHIDTKLVAGGVFGYAGCGFAFEGSTASKLGNYFGFGNSLIGGAGTDYYTIAGGNIGGIIGETDSNIIISAIDAEIMIGEYHGRASDIDDDGKNDILKEGVCENLGNTNIGGLIGQNSSVLIVNNTDLRGYISANTSDVIGGGIGLVSADTYIGTKPQEGDANYNSAIHGTSLVTGGVKCSVDIITNGSIGGFIGKVDADKKVQLSSAMYDGTIHIFTTDSQTDKEIVVGGVIGFVAKGTTGSIDEITIKDSIFGGKILVLGNSEKYPFEGADTKKSVLIDDMSLTVGGIVGEFDYDDDDDDDDAATNAVGQISGCFSYGDVIISYANKFTKLASYVSGGIVGSGCYSVINSSLSIMTSSNDKVNIKKVDDVKYIDVKPIIGIANGSTLGTGTAINKYNSSLCLCYDDYAQDIGYTTAYTSERAGRNFDESKDNTPALDLALEILKGVYGETYTFEAEEVKGSKLNPHQYATNNRIDAKTSMVYITLNGNVEVGDGKTVSVENGLNLRENVNSSGYDYYYGIAFIGDGYTTTYSLDYVGATTQSSSYSLFNVMEQNDIVSGAIVAVDLEYDLNIHEDSNVYAGAIVGKMEGGNIFASGAYGNLSVGAYYNNGVSATTKEINLGGLVGLVESGIVKESYSAVNLVYRAGAYGNVSGFANVVATNVDADAADGIVDHTANVHISSCFSSGKVETYCSANSYAFATSTQNTGTSVSIEDCYTISQIDQNNHTTEADADGEEANFKGTFTSSTCYYSKDVTYNTSGGSASNDYALHTTGITGWTTPSDMNINYGYPVRNFGYLQRSTTVIDDNETEEDTTDDVLCYLVPNAEVLRRIEAGKNYKLEHDIDLSKTASYFGQNTGEAFCNINYTEIFDGNEKTIDNLKYAGLFTTLAGATIRNLRLTNVVMETDGTNAQRLGALARATTETNTIKEIMVSGDLKMTLADQSVGGLIGCVDSGTINILNCENYARIEATNTGVDIGGLVGKVKTTASFTNCTNHGTIEAKKTGQAGGIVGAANGTNTTFTQCGNTNSVLCGYQDDTNGNYYAGGIVGLANGASLSQCYNTAMIKAGNISNKTASYAGGIVGKISSGEVSNCLNEGMIEALSSVEDAVTSYTFVDNNTIKFTYSDGLTRVYADAFANGLTGQNSVNYATVRKNGLYGKKEFEKDFAFDNMGADGFEATKTENGIVVTVGATSDATVYVSQQDELGAPVSFFITVPRTIKYPTKGLGDITRKQEISCTGTFDESATYSYCSIINNIQTDGTDSAIWHTNDGIYYLAFMETEVASEAIKQYKIGAEIYDLPENENQLYMSINQYAKNLHDKFDGSLSYEDPTTGNIITKTIKELSDADYKFEVVVSGDYTAYGISGLRGVADYNSADGGYLDITFSFNLESSGGTVSPSINYSVQAKKNDSVLSNTLSKSNLLWKKRLTGCAERSEGYYVIYLDDEVLNGAKYISRDGTPDASVEEIIAKLAQNNGKYFEVTFAPTTEVATTFKLVKYIEAEKCFVIMDEEAYDTTKYRDGLIPVLNGAKMTFDINQNNTLEARKVVTGSFADFSLVSGSEVTFDKTLSFTTSATFSDGTTNFTFKHTFPGGTHTIENVEIDAKVSDNNGGVYYNKEASGLTKMQSFDVTGYNFTVLVRYNDVSSIKVEQATSGTGSATKSTQTGGNAVSAGSTTNGSISIDGKNYTFGYSSGNYYLNGSSYGSNASGNVELNGRPYTYFFDYDSTAGTVALTLTPNNYYGSVTVSGYGTFDFVASSASSITILSQTVGNNGYINTADNTFKVTTALSGTTLSVTLTLVKYEYEFSNPSIESFNNIGNDYVGGDAVNVTTDSLSRTDEITRDSIVYGTLTPSYKIDYVALDGSITISEGKARFNLLGQKSFASSTFTPSTTFEDTKKDYFDASFKKTMKTTDDQTYGGTDVAYANYSVLSVAEATPTASGAEAQVVVSFNYTIKDVAIVVRGNQYALCEKKGIISATEALDVDMKYDIKNNNIKVKNAAGTVTEEAFSSSKVYSFENGGQGTYSFEVADALAYTYNYKLNMNGWEATEQNCQATEEKFSYGTDDKLHVLAYSKSGDDSVFVTDRFSYYAVINTGISKDEIIDGYEPTKEAQYIYKDLSSYGAQIEKISVADTEIWTPSSDDEKVEIGGRKYSWSVTSVRDASVTGYGFRLSAMTFNGNSLDISNPEVSIEISGTTYLFICSFAIQEYGEKYTGLLSLIDNSQALSYKTETITIAPTKIDGDDYTFKVSCNDVLDADAKANIGDNRELIIKYNALSKYSYFEDNNSIIKIDGIVFVLKSFDGTNATIVYYYGKQEMSTVEFREANNEKVFQRSDGYIYTSFNFDVLMKTYNQIAYEIELGNLHWTEVDDTENLLTQSIINNTAEFEIPDFGNKDYYQVQQNGSILERGTEKGYIEIDDGQKVEVFGVRTESTITLVVKYKTYTSANKNFSGTVNATDETAKGTILTRDYDLGELMIGSTNLSFNGLRNISGNGYVISYTDTNFDSNMFVASGGYMKNLSIAASIFITKEDKNASIFSDEASGPLLKLTTYGSISIKCLNSTSQPLYKNIIGNGLIRDMTTAATDTNKPIRVYVNFSTYYNKFDGSTASIGVVGYYNTFYNITSPTQVYTYNSDDETYTLEQEPEISAAKFYGVVVGFDGKDGENGKEDVDGEFVDAIDGVAGQPVSTKNADSDVAILIKGRGGDGGKGRDGNNGTDFTDKQSTSYDASKPEGNTNGASGADKGDDVHRPTISGQNGYIGFYGLNLIKYDYNDLKVDTTVVYNGTVTLTIGAARKTDGYTSKGANAIHASIQNAYIQASFDVYDATAGRWGWNWWSDSEVYDTAEARANDNIYIYGDIKGTVEWSWTYKWYTGWTKSDLSLKLTVREASYAYATVQTIGVEGMTIADDGTKDPTDLTGKGKHLLWASGASGTLSAS